MKHAPTEITKLVNNFRLHLKEYKKGNYNETQARRDYIDPFFELLGWDIDNKQGYSESYRDVIHEAKIKIGTKTKAPDYSFRIGGVHKFFVEAKKPSLTLKDEIDPAMQIRRYGWNAKLPLCILTDFEELIVYDTRIKPTNKDKPSTARILYFTFEEYEQKWDEIANLFSKEAILKGSFDNYITDGKRKGIETVDNEFLKDVEKWREILAKNLIKNNTIAQRELNFAVQKIIDRIIFLRICEDRNIEDEETLKNLSASKDIYTQLLEYFQKADKKYNSGLFYFKEEKNREGSTDTLTPKLTIEDKPLKEVITSLYYPCPYEFSIMPADILGSVYERFLGKTVALSSTGKSIKVEEKPEVRKAGGVYYTPSYIVNYIVKNTLGEILKGKTLQHVKKLKILDPACGSGSFLIVAYQYLLNWHLEQYRKRPTKHEKEGNIYKIEQDRYRLSTQEKKRILLNHIYGVDIDFQAVEVTKLSLLLKVLEDENKDLLERQMKLFAERALPDLHNNIKCGNSLITPDFYNQGNLGLLTEEAHYRINIFDWNNKQTGFGEIMKNGGFDVVIGNPPYIQIQKMQEFQAGFEAMRFNTYARTGDIYGLFYEQGINSLKPKGLLGYITSNKWMRAAYGEKLRGFLSEKNPTQLIDLGENIFKAATVDTNILIIQNATNQQNLQAKNADSQQALESPKNFVTLKNLTQATWTIANKAEQSIQDKINKYGTPLKDWDIQINRGVLTGYNQAFIIDQAKRDELIAKDPKSKEIIKPILRGRDIQRYKIEFANLYLIATFPALKLNIDDYQAVKEYLKSFGKRLYQTGEKGTRKKTNNKWFETQDQIGYWQEFKKEKIIYSEIVQSPQFYLDNKKYFAEATSFILTGIATKYLIAFLNSKFITFSFKKFYAGGGLGKTGYRYKKAFLEKLPVPKISEQEQQPFIDLVNKMLELNKKVTEATDPHSKEIITRQIKATDNQIDALVYQLYNLTQDEIKVIEN